MKHTSIIQILAAAILAVAAVLGCGGGNAYAPKIEFAAVGFGLTASGAQTVVAGGNGVFTINVGQTTAQPARSADPVTLSVISGLPPEAAATFTPVETAIGESSTLTISTSILTPAQTYTIRVQGQRGSETKTVDVQLTVTTNESFAIAGSAPQTVYAGNPATYTISSSVVQNSAARAQDPVALSIESGLPTDVTASFDPTTVTPGANSTLTLTTQPTAPAGVYTLVVKGTQGSTVRTTTVQLTIQNDFSLSASAAQTISAGTSAQFTISSAVVSPADRSVSPITLTVVNGQPANSNITFAPATIQPGGSSTMLVFVPLVTAPGPYTITVAGQQGSTVRTTTVTLNVNSEFVVTGGGTQNVFVGDPASFTFSTNYGQLGRGQTQVDWAITGGVPSGATAALTPTTAFGDNATLTVNTTGETPPGTYTIFVSANYGGTTKTGSATLVVAAAPDFVLSNNGNTTISLGSNGTVQINVSENAPTRPGRTADQVTLSVTNGLQNFMTANFNTSTVAIGGVAQLTLTLAAEGNLGDFPITVTGTNGFYTHTTTFTVTVTPPGFGG